MPTYSPASSEVRDAISERVASGHYPDLEESQATVSAWFAYAQDGGFAVKVGGQQRGAAIKINSAKDRLEGKADASMTIDGHAWEEWTEEQREAEIDHQLERLVVVRSKPTKRNPVAYILSDDNGRPKLKARPYDYQIGYFVSIARRHGEAAPEVRAVRTFMLENEQQLFPFAGNDREYGHAGAGPRLAAV